MMQSRDPSRISAFVNGAEAEDLYLRLVAPFSDLAASSGEVFFVEILRRASSGEPLSLLTNLPELESFLKQAPAALASRLRLQLTRVRHIPRHWAGLSLFRPLVMGIVNATPDSFSRSSNALDPGAAITQGMQLWEQGAAIIDIGGESTRPGADPVDEIEECRRVLPVVRALAARGIMISIDTRHASVMRAALEAGARIINDVSALAEPAAADLVAQNHLPTILMHMQGDPKTMQQAPSYQDAALDVFDVLEARLTDLERRGAARSQFLVDPGIGFGKTLKHNMALLNRLSLLSATGCGILVGASRKGFIRQAADDHSTTDDRLGGSLAVALHAVSQGAHLVRVHDVAETVQAIRIWEALGHTNPLPEQRTLST